MNGCRSDSKEHHFIDCSCTLSKLGAPRRHSPHSRPVAQGHAIVATHYHGHDKNPAIAMVRTADLYTFNFI